MLTYSKSPLPLPTLAFHPLLCMSRSRCENRRFARKRTGISSHAVADAVAVELKSKNHLKNHSIPSGYKPEDSESKPLLVYVPGIDGSGLTPVAQFAEYCLTLTLTTSPTLTLTKSLTEAMAFYQSTTTLALTLAPTLALTLTLSLTLTQALTLTLTLTPTPTKP